MSGIIGGADLLYTEIREIEDKKQEKFLKRIARNVQNILMLESFMDKVHDPSAGSMYIERLTGELVDKSWKRFQNIISTKKWVAGKIREPDNYLLIKNNYVLPATIFLSFYPLVPVKPKIVNWNWQFYPLGDENIENERIAFTKKEHKFFILKVQHSVQESLMTLLG